MTYNEFLNTISSGLSYLTLTGLTDVIYINYTLEDLIELDVNTYPGTSGVGKSVFLCPIPMTIDSDDIITYGVRVYIAQQINEDSSDRFSAISSCIELVKMLIQWLPDNLRGLTFPVTITPVLLFDATVEGLYFEFNFSENISCLV